MNSKIRSDFPILEKKIRGQPLIYLDSAATTLKPRSVINALEHHYREESANIHRGVHFLSERATEAYESARLKVQKFINASSPNEIIFTHGTTESINLAAYSFGRKFIQKNDDIIISHMEHHSNIVPWQILRDEIGCNLKIIPITDNGELDLDAFKSLLSEKTKLVAITHVSNTLGTVNDIQHIINLSHDAGAHVLIDGAQAVSSLYIDVQKLNCDFYVFSGHKLFGPTGVGVLYGKSKLLTEMPPFIAGGDMIASVTFEKTIYNTIPFKFEAGTPPIAGVIGLGAAIDYVTDVGLDVIASHESELLEYGTKKLQAIDGLKLIGQAKNKISVLTFVLGDIHPHDIGTLVDQEGVAIRTGHLCTQPLMLRYNVPAVARASLSLYNTRDEIDQLVNALAKVKETFR